MRRCVALSESDLKMHMTVLDSAMGDFLKGKDCARHWSSLADMANFSETLCGMRLGGGPDAERVIREGQQALFDVFNRSKQRGTWTLYPGEIDALQWLLQLHKTQLRVCSYGEFEVAFNKTVERLKQARAGNVGDGVVVVEGLL